MRDLEGAPFAKGAAPLARGAAAPAKAAAFPKDAARFLDAAGFLDAQDGFLIDAWDAQAGFLISAAGFQAGFLIDATGFLNFLKGVAGFLKLVSARASSSGPSLEMISEKVQIIVE